MYIGEDAYTVFRGIQYRRGFHADGFAGNIQTTPKLKKMAELWQL